MNTVITEKTASGEVSYDIFSKLINHRVLFLYDDIDNEVATDLVATLLFLDSIDQVNPITIYINSESGDIRSILMIYDVIAMIKAPIQTVCIGAAMYAPILILAAGTKGYRYATKSSCMCVSALIPDSITSGDITKTRSDFEQIKKENTTFIEILSKLTSRKQNLIIKDCAKRLFLTPLQAKRYGLIDHIIRWHKK